MKHILLPLLFLCVFSGGYCQGNDQLNDKGAALTEIISYGKLNKKLRDNFYKLLEQQANEKLLKAAEDSINNLDSVYYQKMDRFISRFGWVEHTSDNKKAVKTFILILSHSGIKAKPYLDWAEQAKSDKMISKMDYAILVDKVCLAEEKPMIYGTQTIFKENGLYYAGKLDGGVKGVNIRRNKLGIGSLDGDVLEQ